MAPVTIDSGPITHTTDYAEVPAQRRISLLGAWRQFFNIDASITAAKRSALSMT